MFGNLFCRHHVRANNAIIPHGSAARGWRRSADATKFAPITLLVTPAGCAEAKRRAGRRRRRPSRPQGPARRHPPCVRQSAVRTPP